MALYEELAFADIIEPVQNLIGPGRPYRLCEDGKIRGQQEISMYTDGPWVNVKICPLRHCTLWHHVYFRGYDFISRNCFNCWKIVIKPQNLKDLFHLHELELRMDLPSKAGIERRDYAKHGGIYSGFFYAPLDGGLDGAKDLCKRVSLKVKDALGLQTPVFLKRGCTEFENKFGPSNLWEYPDEMHQYEDLMDAVWDIAEIKTPEPMVVKTAVFRRWIGWAIQHGDPTAEDFYDSIETLGVTPAIKYNDQAMSLTANPKTSRERRGEDETPKIQGLPED